MQTESGLSENEDGYRRLSKEEARQLVERTLANFGAVVEGEAAKAAGEIQERIEQLKDKLPLTSGQPLDLDA